MLLPVTMFQIVILCMWVMCVKTIEIVVSYNVREEQDALTFVGNVARDSFLYTNVSTDQFQRMKFQILIQGNPVASLFQIDESVSSLRTAAILDRENICLFLIDCVLKFNVAVYSKVKETDNLDLFRIIEIRVTLDDINDNTPEFQKQQFSITIPEDSNVNSEYFINGARDLDTGANNSVQSYVMQPISLMFALKVLNNSDGSTDLSIVVKSPLDREMRSSYQLVVYAMDGGVPILTGSVIINITIADVNDNTPIFNQSEYNVTVKENNPVYTTVLVVMATDADVLVNGLVSYRFNSRTSNKILDVFDINNNGTVIAKAVLDYEDVTKLTFKVEAFDHGSPAKTTTVMVNVNVEDVNDNYPQINVNLPPGGTKISEAADIGSFIAHVAVYDLDVVSGAVVCKVQGDDFRLEDFKIENNYKIVLNEKLDYETKMRYEVSIECKDSGVPPLTNVSSFIVLVEDVNDNSPVFFRQIYQVTIQEEVFQSMIVQVSAKDLDSGDNGKVAYGLVQNTDKRFNLNSQTGLLTANAKFDREVDMSLVLQVIVWDFGQVPLTSTATVIVNITDVNDNAPKCISNPVNIYFTENDPYQTVNLNVTDPDLGLNGQFLLKFPQNDLSEYFQFNSLNGEIKTVKAIDREYIPYFKLSVTAIDKGIPAMTSSMEVIINIVDVNDNIPAITYPNNSNNTKMVPLTAPVGFLIATVLATDKDEGPNGQVLYFIDSGNTENLFLIDVNNGCITVGREMVVKDAATYKLQITVRDNGEIQRASYATINIIVEPVNETSWSLPLQENRQNLMLVAVIVTITAVLSIAIIVTIFIIKSIDRRTRQHQMPSKVNENRLYDMPHVDESMLESSNISKDSDVELLKKRSRKEVSFSLDDDCSAIGNHSALTDVSSLSTLKQYEPMDYKAPQTSQSNTLLCNNRLLSADTSQMDMFNETDINRLTPSQLQTVIRHITGSQSDRLWLHPVREEESQNMTQKTADDTRSETSHESATSDSGRGGSEEDINSNRGHPISDSEKGNQYFQCDGQSNLLLSEKTMPQRPPPPIPTECYPRIISFCEDSVTAHITVVSSERASSPSCLSLQKSYHNNLEMLAIIAHSNSHDTHLCDEMLLTLEMLHSVQNHQTVREMSGTFRDDVSSTTSGSYTISPDELCNEIDELFFKDIIV